MYAPKGLTTYEEANGAKLADSPEKKTAGQTIAAEIVAKKKSHQSTKVPTEKRSSTKGRSQVQNKGSLAIAKICVR
jgi:hypothetical protein